MINQTTTGGNTQSINNMKTKTYITSVVTTVRRHAITHNAVTTVHRPAITQHSRSHHAPIVRMVYNANKGLSTLPAGRAVPSWAQRCQLTVPPISEHHMAQHTN